jgi:hypothetical protein
MKDDQMDDDKTELHVYGTPAPEKQDPPAIEGMRGEGSPTAADTPDDQTRSVTAEGRKITVTETSGTASAEAQGATLKAKL